jgi:Domain of unknown function (DUF4259)
MGAWGTGPFENDDAQDFVLDLAEAPETDLEGRLTAGLTLSDGYLEAPEGSAAVAAAALVAIGAGMVPPDSPTVADFLASRVVPTTPELRAAARLAVDRVVGEDSELWELWQEAGSINEITAIMGGIPSAL